MRLRAILICALALAACSGDDNDGSTGSRARDFKLRIENVAPWTVLKTSTQTVKTTGAEGSAGGGEAFEIRFTANHGQFISFVSMLGESNDWFFAPGPDGIPLFNDGTPISGDVTRFVKLWDAGTEIDQEPAVGNATGLLQPSRDFGDADPNDIVREVPASVRLADGTMFTTPPVTSMIRVTLTAGADQQFTLRIQNIGSSGALMTSLGPKPIHLSPLVWALHRVPAPFFTPGEPARDNGLESLAEAGLPDPLGTAMRNLRGYATPLSPGIVVVHTEPAPLFMLGATDSGQGLEALAEDGNPKPLTDALVASPPPGVKSTSSFTMPLRSLSASAADPGQSFEVIVHGKPGDLVSFATMFEMSDDWFFASQPDGIALFFDDAPRACDVTAETALFDLGTETDEELDVGPDVGTQQLAPNSGKPDKNTQVRAVTLERYGVPSVLHLRVTLTPL